MSNSNSKSTYKVDVLKANTTFKNACRSTGKGLRVLKSALKDDKEFLPMVRQIDKILNDKTQKLYKEIDKNVQRIKTGDNKGKTCPYYILQAVYKQKEGKSFKKNNSTKTKTKVSVNKPKNAPKNAPKLQSQTVKQLRAMASELSLNVPSQIKKADLITMIKKAA